jgi:hypothetical protein
MILTIVALLGFLVPPDSGEVNIFKKSIMLYKLLLNRK